MLIYIYRQLHVGKLIYDFLFMDVDKIFLFNTLQWFSL
jgi:hypothetical protein